MCLKRRQKQEFTAIQLINYKIRAIREILGRELDDHTKSMLMLAYLIEDVLDIYDNLNGGNKQ